jgi:hypothetical protein
MRGAILAAWGEYWLRGAILAAWGDIGCVGQYHVGEAMLWNY